MSIIKSNAVTTLPELISDIFDTDYLFDNRFLTPRWVNAELTKNIPSANVKENKKEFSIELAAPGLEKKDFKIGIENDLLSISAEKHIEKKEENENYMRHEFEFDAFNRSFRLPKTVNLDKIDAKYENGLLKLTIPKKAETISAPKKEIMIK